MQALNRANQRVLSDAGTEESEPVVPPDAGTKIPN